MFEEFDMPVYSLRCAAVTVIKYQVVKRNPGGEEGSMGCVRMAAWIRCLQLF